MKAVNNHPYVSSRTIKAWETNKGEFLQILDTRDLIYDNYSVEFQLDPGGLTTVFMSTNLNRCFEFIKKFDEMNLRR